MYALVRTGGKQYRVAKDDTILVERIAADEGAEVILDDVVMLGDGDKVTIGTPRVEGAAVSATVVSQTRGPKIIIFRRKRRNSRRTRRSIRFSLSNRRSLKACSPNSIRKAISTLSAFPLLPFSNHPNAGPWILFSGRLRH